jgi:hypothetical protein
VILLWLIVWLLEGTPTPTFDPLNVWAVTLVLAGISALTVRR